MESETRGKELFSADYLIGSIFFITLFVFSLVYARRNYILLIALLAYLIILLPVIGVIQVGNQIAADRYTYLSLIPVTVLIVFWFVKIAQHRINYLRFGFILFLVLITAMMVRTRAQMEIWESTYILWSHQIKLYPGVSDVAYYGRGLARHHEQRDLESAKKDYDYAIFLNSDNYNALISRGILFGEQGEYQLALADFNKAISINRRSHKAFSNRGVLFHLMGKNDMALRDYNSAITLNPRDVVTHANLASIYKSMGELDKAAYHSGLAE